MQVKHIIVQAGGRGSRMQYLTRNKPKALVPVENRPLIFHLFEAFPHCKFIIIGDYKCDVLERYLEVFAKVEYAVVKATGNTGTCAGLGKALTYVPDNESFMLVWSDLILNSDLNLSALPTGCYIGLSKGFECRWKYEDNVFLKEPSSTCGVAGMFLFDTKKIIQNVPQDGEFVDWLSRQSVPFGIIPLKCTREYGLISEYNKLERQKCRPFNRITFFDNYILKEGIDEQGRQLAVREKVWYQKAIQMGISCLPQIYETEPLKLERIHGKNVFEYTDLSFEQKKSLLSKIVLSLKELHDCSHVVFDEESFKDAYLGKTFARLETVQKLIPFAEDPYIIINGKRCRNVFFHRILLEQKFSEWKPKKFAFIHGDCTFSNILLRNDKEPVLIDPRGYFGQTELYGDPAYDWAKLYYSIVGNYDQFNRKYFTLEICNNAVNLDIQSSKWEILEDEFFQMLSGEIERTQIQLIHAIIWLSLTTYAWEDYDSICAAFYNGLQYLEDVL